MNGNRATWHEIYHNTQQYNDSLKLVYGSSHLLINLAMMYVVVRLILYLKTWKVYVLSIYAIKVR